MDQHKKKMIAPIVISIFLVVYYSIFFIFAFTLEIPLIVEIVALIVSILSTGVVAFVLVERLKEIRSGEEDDISKY
ncbi:MAG: hypothetical protein PHY47_23470 [Lachnospiraceae bacterium]|nr:hypothetical protein [Lachnospiraceae bacterium]